MAWVIVIYNFGKLYISSAHLTNLVTLKIFETGTTSLVLGKPKLITLFDALYSWAHRHIAYSDIALIDRNLKWKLIPWYELCIQILFDRFSVNLIFGHLSINSIYSRVVITGKKSWGRNQTRTQHGLVALCCNSRQRY